jgi:hypothetical protein
MAAMDDGLRQQGVGLLIVHGVAVIVEHLPPDLPVRDAELAALETYLGDIVDGILAEIECGSRAAQRRRGIVD